MPMGKREIKALQIVAEKGIYEVGDGTFKVVSSNMGQYHTVRVANGKRICDCPDFAKRKKCKHVYAVTYYLMIKDLVSSIHCKEEDVEVACPHCDSKQIVKAGLRYNQSGPVQRYYCKSCKRSFRDPKGFKQSRYNPHIIATALDLYCRGLSLREVADHLKSTYNIEVSHGTIYMWIRRYVELVHKYTSGLSKNTRERWCADETIVHVRSRDLLLWMLLDYETRLLISHHISAGRFSEDASRLIRKGVQSAHSPPQELVSDGNPAYHKAIENELQGTPLIHVVGPLAGPVTNNRSERLNQTVKRRIKKVMHFKSEEGAETFMKAFEVFYNFIRPHQALENSTPAERAGIMKKISWHELIKMAKSKNNKRK